MLQGGPCSVRYSGASYHDSTPGQYTLEIPPLDDSDGLPGSSIRSARGDAGDESCSYLEVVRQGQYIGLRSAAASNRFLQPRRKFPHQLVFFNGKLGVWEQWEILGEEAGGGKPWRQTKLGLRSRRLPHVELHFDALRVGVYGTGPGLPAIARGAGLSAVSEIPMMMPYDDDDGLLGGEDGVVDDDLREDVQLMRINGLFVHEWMRYGLRCLGGRR